MKTVSVALVLCLNVGVDPPDVVKISPCARLECWIGKMYIHFKMIINFRPLVKSVYQKINFLISQPKHMLWVLKRTVSIRWFF